MSCPKVKCWHSAWEAYDADKKVTEQSVQAGNEAQEKRDKAWDKARQEYWDALERIATYELFTDNAYTLKLEDGEYLPLTVTFQKWDENNGWTVPEDEEEAKKVVQKLTFTGIQSKQEPFELGYKFSVHAEWLNEVHYRFKADGDNSQWVTVGYDPKKATLAYKAETNADYELFDENGNFAINPGDNAVFPCTVIFRVRSASGSYTDTEQTFETSRSEVKVRDHTFTIRKDWKNEVVYTVDSKYGETMTVGRDTAWAAAHNDYDAACDDGSYAISVSEEIEFPLRVTFRLRNSTRPTTYIFKNPDDVFEYGGFTFSIRPRWMDEVSFTLTTYTQDNGTVAKALNPRTVTVGKDTKRAEEAKKAAEEVTEEQLKENPLLAIPDYALPNADNTFTIELPENDAFYPYGLEFSYSRVPAFNFWA